MFMSSGSAGLIFFKAANDGNRMFDHLKFCIGIVFFLAYTQIIVPILACKYSMFIDLIILQFEKKTRHLESRMSFDCMKKCDIFCI